MFKDPKFKKYFEYVSLGGEIAVAFSVPILAGYWLDGVWESSPWMLLAGILTGVVLMIAIFMRVIRNMNKKDG